MISVRNLTKRYENKEVVKDVTLNIEKGLITSFIGPNGAGKSTLLSMISRLMEANDGDVQIDGISLKNWKSKELAQKISILRQSNNLNVRLTVRELVAFGRFPYSKGNLTEEDNQFIDQAIDYLKLKDIEDCYINELSGGQKQRAYIAMVIAQDTEYILLDEPLNNLDMKHAVEIMKILRNIVDDLGKTVVIVIHDINFASCYSDKIVALQDGKIRYYDDTDKIINSEVLNDVFDMEFNVHHLGGKKICTYYEEGACDCKHGDCIHNSRHLTIVQ
ncbi:ATP-binding cassette domain-containing protein [Proteiniclasticum sp.]|uniref:iron ABC transporter ATP-binding protein n=1 Tax=Proteiniclasticum sp. TaxID=2053595 RepID=UPI0028A0572D|nr:ATP-binding cassette domain-containing protein [Proteiniclasticum sp.]